LRGLEISYELFVPEFFIKMTPSTSRDRNFLASNPFLPIFSAIDVQKRRALPTFEHHKQWCPHAKKTARNPTLSVLWLASLP
jgi:hypothetical protein